MLYQAQLNLNSLLQKKKLKKIKSSYHDTSIRVKLQRALEEKLWEGIVSSLGWQNWMMLTCCRAMKRAWESLSTSQTNGIDSERIGIAWIKKKIHFRIFFSPLKKRENNKTTQPEIETSKSK